MRLPGTPVKQPDPCKASHRWKQCNKTHSLTPATQISHLSLRHGKGLVSHQPLTSQISKQSPTTLTQISHLSLWHEKHIPPTVFTADIKTQSHNYHSNSNQSFEFTTWETETCATNCFYSRFQNRYLPQQLRPIIVKGTLTEYHKTENVQIFPATFAGSVWWLYQFLCHQSTFCFKAEPLRVQPSWFTLWLYQQRTEKGWFLT